MWSISRTFLETFKSGFFLDSVHSVSLLNGWLCTFLLDSSPLSNMLRFWRVNGGFKFGCVFFQKDTQKPMPWNLIPEFHHPSMDVMSWLNPVGPPRSERCGGAGRLLLAQIDLWKPTTGWVVGRFFWMGRGGCYRSRMTWVSEPKWNDHKVLDTPKWLKGWRSTSNGGSHYLG